MARIESKAAGGFYPMPEEWLPLIANLFQPSRVHGRMIDPFAGEGDALKYLANAWNLEPYAIEVDEERGRKCQDKFGYSNAIIDDCYNCKVSDFSFPIAYVNPPFDTDVIADRNFGSRRSELRAMKFFWNNLQSDGYMIWIAYSQHMTGAVFESLANNATKIDVYRFPGAHLDNYTMICIVAQFQKRKNRPTQKWIDDNVEKFIELGKNPSKIQDISLGNIPVRRTVKDADGTEKRIRVRETYVIPPPKHLRRFLFIPKKLDKIALTELNIRHGAHRTPAFVEIVAPVEAPPVIKPIAQPRYGQLAVIMAAGMLDGIQITHEGIPAILRGSVQRLSIKVKEETDEDSYGRERKTEIIHDKPISAIIVLNEKGGIFNITEHTKLVDFITLHRDELMEYFDRHYSPAYDMNINQFWGNTFDTHLVRSKYPMLPTQEHVSTALSEHLLVNRAAILVGEPSFGKSPTTISVIINLIRAQKAIDEKTNEMGFMADRYGIHKLEGIKPGKPVVILCPAIMPEQWADEIKMMYPAAKTMIVKRIADARELFESAKKDKSRIYIGLLSYESAKLGEGWAGACMVHRHYDREWKTLKDGQHINEITIDREALEPVTGAAYKERKTKNSVLRPVSPERLEAKMIFYEGPVFDGYEEVIDSSGKKVRKAKFFHALNRPVDESEIAEGYRQMSLPMFSFQRRLGLPKIGNGRVKYEDVEVTIPVHTVSTLKKVRSFGSESWVNVESQTKERTYVKRVFTENINPKEPVLDEWLATKGVRCTTNSKKSNKIDQAMEALKLKVYDYGSGNKDLDKALKRLGVSRYYLGMGEVSPRPPRFPVAEFIALRYKGDIGLLVCDEIHKIKGIDTDRGVASRILIQAAEKVLGLTGTLYGGVASSIYAIEFAFNPRVREKFPWIRGAPIHWIKAMGTIEEQWRTQASYSNGAYTGTKRVNTVMGKEAPGCSPLLVRELMDHCVFVGLKDLGGVMPDFSEIPEETQMDAAMKALYGQIYNKLKDYLKRCIIGGDGSFVASFYQNMLRLPDSMHRDNVVHHRPRKDKWDPKSAREDKIVMTIPAIGDYIKPKEQRLVDLMIKKIEAGKRVIVYVSQTGTRDIQDRLQEFIHNLVPGSKAFILRHVDTTSRVRWIQGKVDEGYNVMITNPGLVTEGVNLIMFSTTIYIEIESSLTTMTQSSRRTWRLSQPEKSVDIYYLYYNDVFQSGLLFGLADKTAAANVLYGNEGGTLSGLSDTVETFDDLAKVIEEGKAISKAEIAAKFNASAYNSSADFTESSWFAEPRRDYEWYFGKKRAAEDFVEAAQDIEEIAADTSPIEFEDV